MAQAQHTPNLASLEEGVTVLFCLIDDAYAHLNPDGRAHESLERLSDSKVLTLALFQQLRGTESERSFLRDAQRFFSHLFPGVVGMHPSSLHRHVRLVGELLSEAGLEQDGLARRLFGDLAYRGGALGEKPAERGILLTTQKAERRPPIRQQVEVCFAALKRVFGMDGTLAKTLTGLATRIAAKVAAYAYGCYVNRMLGRPQGRIKELVGLMSSQHSSRGDGRLELSATHGGMRKGGGTILTER